MSDLPPTHPDQANDSTVSTNTNNLTKESGASADPGSRATELLEEAAKLRTRAEGLEAEATRLQVSTGSAGARRAIEARSEGVAVFLGAGASKGFGFPLTRELLPTIIKRLADEELFEDERINNQDLNAEHRTLLKKTLLSLCPGLQITSDEIDRNKMRLPLVTSLLSMLDFSLASGQTVVSGLTSEKTREVRSLLERAIYEAIERDKPAGATEFSARLPAPVAGELADWLKNLRETSPVTIITSNYDVAIEKSWGFEKRNFEQVQSLGMDFGFDWIWPADGYPEDIMRRPSPSKHRIFKLHGSTNWLRCGLCDRVYINPEVDIAIYSYERREDRMLARTCHCGHERLEVQIVSPSFVRDMRTPNLMNVWQQSLESLRRAQDWVIIGYSFPDEDLNIRSLFTRALASRYVPPKIVPPHVTVVQSSSNDQARYEAFFPKKNFTYLTDGLEGFVPKSSRVDAASTGFAEDHAGGG